MADVFVPENFDLNNHLILCFDLSKSMTGMAIYADTDLIQIKKKSFSGAMPYGELFDRFHDWLTDVTDDYVGIGIDAVFVEHNFRMPGPSQEIQTTLMTALRAWCFWLDIPLYGVSAASIAKAAGAKQGDKDSVVDYVLGLGVDLGEGKRDDLADAVMIGRVVYDSLIEQDLVFKNIG